METSLEYQKWDAERFNRGKAEGKAEGEANAIIALMESSNLAITDAAEMLNVSEAGIQLAKRLLKEKP